MPTGAQILHTLGINFTPRVEDLEEAYWRDTEILHLALLDLEPSFQNILRCICKLEDPVDWDFAEPAQKPAASWRKKHICDTVDFIIHKLLRFNKGECHKLKQHFRLTLRWGEIAVIQSLRQICATFVVLPVLYLCVRDLSKWCSYLIFHIDGYFMILNDKRSLPFVRTMKSRLSLIYTGIK